VIKNPEAHNNYKTNKTLFQKLFGKWLF
jgi:hypothetical protein